jgi:hypothetical protein
LGNLATPKSVQKLQTALHAKAKAQQAAFVCASLDRAGSFAAALTRDLARCAALERESMAIIAELTALAVFPRLGKNL